jgi:hypothetical protein
MQQLQEEQEEQEKQEQQNRLRKRQQRDGEIMGCESDDEVLCLNHCSVSKQNAAQQKYVNVVVYSFGFTFRTIQRFGCDWHQLHCKVEACPGMCLCLSVPVCLIVLDYRSDFFC